MNEQKNNGRGIFYGVIGVATLVVAIIGATFAYFTATAANNVMTGNMATINLNLAVTKVTTADVDKGGMVPMSNTMIQAAISNGSGNGICVDDNGNAVCQVYKITLENNSSAGQFVDGYVALRGGSGAPTDYPYSTGKNYTDATGTTLAEGLKGTTMRWTQVFCTESGNTVTSCTTAGVQSLLDDSTTESTVTFTELIGSNEGTGVEVDTFNTTYLLSSGVTTDTHVISGNKYTVINKNYIRVSDHSWSSDGGKESYKRQDDMTSALVLNHSLSATKTVTYFFAVWLSETGTNQTPGTAVGNITNPSAASFFGGNVTFNSAQGSEVSATFSGYAKVQSDQVAAS